jgi:hypothetical protein
VVLGFVTPLTATVTDVEFATLVGTVTVTVLPPPPVIVEAATEFTT